MTYISPRDLKPLLTDGNEMAFLDIREHGQYGEGHPFFCVPMPYSCLESLAQRLLPRKSVRLFLMDDGDGVSERAAQRLKDAGYSNISVVEGGAPAWAQAGYTLYKGVNVPSKTYGELLEHAAETPTLTAKELHRLREDDPSLVVLDGRTPGEFGKMSLPGALCCPNAELGYRLAGLVADDSTTIVINCAGRTRSILGVEGLRLLNTANPLYALENGTQGWCLAGFDLDHGVAPQRLLAPQPAELEALQNQAASLIEAYGIELISAAKLVDWQNDNSRSTYLLDVRTAEEYAESHWAGARHAPGGQLVQATDQYVAVRNARIVLSDDIQLRAATTAIRLQQMGHSVYLLDADARCGDGSTKSSDIDNRSSTVSRDAFAQLAHNADAIVDTSSGIEYRDAHIEGAHWVTRARVDRLAVDHNAKLLVTGRKREIVDGVVSDLMLAGYISVQACVGSPTIWRDAGCTIVSSPDSPSDADCIDYLFFVHDRHDGNLDAARRYLEWEVGLIGQLDEQERSVLNPHARSQSGGN